MVYLKIIQRFKGSSYYFIWVLQQNTESISVNSFVVENGL